MKFRSIVKEPVPGQAPVAIVDEIRDRAARQRKSHSEVVTELLCQAIGVDPTSFGIDKATRRRSPSPN